MREKPKSWIGLETGNVLEVWAESTLSALKYSVIMRFTETIEDLAIAANLEEINQTSEEAPAQRVLHGTGIVHLLSVSTLKETSNSSVIKVNARIVSIDASGKKTLVRTPRIWSTKQRKDELLYFIGMQ